MTSEGDFMYEKITRFNKKQKIVFAIIAAVIVLAVAITGILLASKRKDDSKETDNNKIEKVEEEEAEEVEQTEVELDEEDPQSVVIEEEETKEEIGAVIDASDVFDDNRTGEITYGIDVSKYQGTIDWKKVADSGVDFAMIRIGYRTLIDGKIVADSNAKYNMQEAQKNGIKVGGYFFSTAVSNAEAVEEANWVADYVAKYQITYPIAYDCEGYDKVGNRHYGMTNTQRTDVALAFMGRIAERGYSPLFYGAKSEMENDAKWEMNRISSIYSVWVAQYPASYSHGMDSNYNGSHIMWQYTNRGTVPGIKGNVDMNIAYFGYAYTEDAKDSEAPEDAKADVEALMNFTSVNETVTAKEKTNLRDKPSQGSDSTVMHTLVNGDTATRTGVSNSGWSRVVYNGKTYYAVSSYLTTDLGYKPPQEEPDDGIETEFTAVNEQVTAKEAVNLRTLPSVTNEESQVVVQIKNGDVVTRTGINTELGWSRVVYNGQTLYCVSSYLMPVEEETT